MMEEWGLAESSSEGFCILGLVEAAGAARTDRQALPEGEEVAVAAFPKNTPALISSSNWKYTLLPFGGQIHLACWSNLRRVNMSARCRTWEVTP